MRQPLLFTNVYPFYVTVSLLCDVFIFKFSVDVVYFRSSENRQLSTACRFGQCAVTVLLGLVGFSVK